MGFRQNFLIPLALPSVVLGFGYHLHSSGKIQDLIFSTLNVRVKLFSYSISVAKRPQPGRGQLSQFILCRLAK